MKSITLSNGIRVNMKINGCGHYTVFLKREDLQLETSTNNSEIWDYMENDDFWDDYSEAKHNRAVSYLEILSENLFDVYDYDHRFDNE